jgi:hypothetical protein
VDGHIGNYYLGKYDGNHIISRNVEIFKINKFKDLFLKQHRESLMYSEIYILKYSPYFVAVVVNREGCMIENDHSK